MKQHSLKSWFKSGAPGVWISAGAVSIAVIMTIGLLLLIAVRGLGHFWPADLLQASYQIPGQAAHLMRRRAGAGRRSQPRAAEERRLPGAGRRPRVHDP